VSHNHFVPVISLRLITQVYLMTLKVTSIGLEAEGFYALNYARRWAIALLTHYVFLCQTVTNFLL